MMISRFLSSTALVCASLAAVPAYAQGTPATGSGQDDPATLQSEVEIESGADAQRDAGEADAIVVTGSRIRRPNLESNVPVTSIGGEQFIQSGDVSVGDTLNELPQLSSTFSQQNPGLGVGIAGLNLLDLRGLGTARTLVLVNGRRHVAADIQNNAVSVDINTIPNDLIERVDIVTGAQSSIYGSDAIAGVVNFILRRDYDGLQLRANATIAGEGYGGEQYVSAMFGKNFAEGRGNITLHGEYSRTERLFGSDIGKYRTNDGLFVVDVDPSGSDGIPDRTFLRDVRSSTINRNGLVPVSQRIGGSAPCGTSAAANSAPFNCTFLFDQNGRLITQTGSRTGTTINPIFVGGNGQTGREDNLLSILPQLERYNANLLARFEFSDAAELFVEAKYARVEGAGNNAATTFTQGGSFDANRERIRLDNPFLNPADRTTLANAFLTSGCVPTITGAACPAAGNLTAAQQAQIAAGTFRFPIGKQFLDLGIRDQTFQRETYRAVVGLRGTFNTDWSYELSANYGKFEESNTNSGFVDRQKFLLALDAGRNPATGQIQCRSQFDPAAAVPFQSAGLQASQNAFIAARLQSDIAACVPLNPFGSGSASNQAAANYVSFSGTDTASIEQFVVSGFVSGDLSQLFELPGGPIGFAVGGEYRREDAEYTQPNEVLQGVTNFLVLGNARPEATEIKEAFAEVRLPLLRDVPFFQELSVTAAGRISDYSTIGTVYSYNAGAEWSPVRGVRFRGNYGRSVRAPSVAETAFPIVPNFAPGFADPCSGAQIGAGSGTRAANCAADLGALLPNLASLGAPSLAVLSGSNPNLKEETSDSYTLGVVLQPTFLPGFSFSADYYDIEVKDVIVALGAQAIANNCYDSPTLNNPFCSLFQRYRGPAGGGGFDEIPGQIQGNTLLQSGLNFASRTRRGIDFELAYRANLGPARVETNLIYVHTLESSNFQDPIRPKFENVLRRELGTPADEFRWDTDLKFGAFTFGYQLRYIGEQYVSTFESFNTTNGEPPTNLDFAVVDEYPEVFYHAIRFQWDVTNPANGKGGLRFYVGVDNLLNTFAPFGLTGTVGTDAIYETQGRTFYAGVRARF
ncbi:MAG TPA: TonB-dependent receptor [Sphingomonadaceae bacterium]|nr:TonB-dependent receptor [Sphingomonadaceae bacterium]